MPFIAPMLASPFPKKGFIPTFGQRWVGEEKFDGIRVVIEVERDCADDLLSDSRIRAWSRYGILQMLPRHLLDALGKLPTGVYDGEMFVPGERSFGAKKLLNASKLRVVIFDLLSVHRESIIDVQYQFRRTLLQQIFAPEERQSDVVTLAESRDIYTLADLEAYRDEVWARDGEGLIVKEVHALYYPGKRPSTWFKVKKLQTEVLEVIGFAPSKGEIFDRGPYATIIVRDVEGVVTTVKTRNDYELEQLQKQAPVRGQHPAIGRRLRIEFQERTPDGSYRHPRFDRWCDEQEK